MNTRDLEPTQITREQLKNPYLSSLLAQRAFRQAHYDMCPDDPVQSAIDRGLLEVVDDSVQES